MVWECKPEVRWVDRKTAETRMSEYGYIQPVITAVLQQKWVRQNDGLVEWRDVPTVEEQ